jgi:hypothetical protein
MDEFTQSLSVVILGLVLVCAAMASCTAKVSEDDNAAMVEMVKHGARPIEAKCAIKGSAGSECAILSTKQ